MPVYLPLRAAYHKCDVTTH